eukprot:scaffold3756_cov180-Ochromonas_danica.AAC.10
MNELIHKERVRLMDSHSSGANHARGACLGERCCYKLFSSLLFGDNPIANINLAETCKGRRGQ